MAGGAVADDGGATGLVGFEGVDGADAGPFGVAAETRGFGVAREARAFDGVDDAGLFEAGTGEVVAVVDDRVCVDPVGGVVVPSARVCRDWGSGGRAR